MQPDSSSQGPLSSSPWFRASANSSISSQNLSPATSPLAVQSSITKGPPIIASRTVGVDPHRLHAQLVVVQGRKCNPRVRTSRSRRISPYHRSRSLSCLSVNSQRFLEKAPARTGSRRVADRKPDAPLVPPLKYDLQSIVFRKSTGSQLQNCFQNLRLPALPSNSVFSSASLRKAQSLRVVVESDSLAQDESENLVPTEPATPCALSPSAQGDDDLSCMPILSPVVTTVPYFPLSAETTAKIRIGKYKEREGRTLDNDHSRMKRTDNNLSLPVSNEVDWELLMGLGETTREEHLNWLFHFLPEDDDSESTSSSFSSTSSVVSLGSGSRYPQFNTSKQNLINQLTTSPETRFHAAWMFLRYHWLLGLNRKHKVTATHLPLYPSSGIWDVTLAALAISMKFHRDFLFPLIPIEAAEYMDISPHNMNYEALEYAQRTMLDTFSYELGITPQPILDQLWIALPSLRELFGFDGGWNQVKKETWRLLISYLYEADVMKFSVSVLTTTAVSSSLVSVLAQRYYYESDWNNFSNHTHSTGKGRHGFEIAKKFRDAAIEDTEGVILDVQAVIGVSQEEANECQQWLDSRTSITKS